MRLKTATVDAVILDLRLADERSGLEVLEQMRLDARYDDVPVVVLTGVTEVDQAEDEIIQRHGAHLLYKRFGYREVVQRLEKIITVQRRNPSTRSRSSSSGSGPSISSC